MRNVINVINTIGLMIAGIGVILYAKLNKKK